MRMLHLVLPSCALGFGGIIGALIGGGMMHTMIADLLCLWIAAPALIVLSFMVIERFQHRGQPSATSGLMMGCAALAMLVLGFTGGGTAVFQYREAEVRRFVSEVLPLLDAHKQKSGSYPQNLREVTDKRLPYYLRGRGRYNSNGDTFSFYYENPDAIMVGLMLTDSHRAWRIAD